MIFKFENLDIQILNSLDAVEKIRNVILILISINDFNLKSFDNNSSDIDSKTKNEID